MLILAPLVPTQPRGGKLDGTFFRILQGNACLNVARPALSPSVCFQPHLPGGFKAVQRLGWVDRPATIGYDG
jgi:hypothetical protein